VSDSTVDCSAASSTRTSFPACNVTEVPEEEPINDAGFGLLPETVMVKVIRYAA
jgi:hypothetical protein